MKPMKWNSFLIRDEIFLLILLKMYLLCEKLLCFFFFWIFDLLNFSFINLAKEQQLHESIESKLVIACKHMKRLARVRENVFSFGENNSFIKWNIKRCTFNLDFLVLSSNNFYTNIHIQCTYTLRWFLKYGINEDLYGKFLFFQNLYDCCNLWINNIWILFMIDWITIKCVLKTWYFKHKFKISIFWYFCCSYCISIKNFNCFAGFNIFLRL